MAGDRLRVTDPRCVATWHEMEPVVGDQVRRPHPHLRLTHGVTWRDRMRFRHGVHRDLIERLAADGDPAEGWTIDAAADLFYALALPGPWRELTRELVWTADRYGREMSRSSAAAYSPLPTPEPPPTTGRPAKRPASPPSSP